MQNDYRKSIQSRRRTLLCCSTLCLLIFLILFLFLTEVFHRRFISFDRNLNKTISLNLIKYRSSLIQCGKSVVQHENFNQIIEQLKEIIKNNKRKLSLNIRKEEIIIWLEFILSKCFQARQFSVLEQQKPTFIRRFISFLRKEFLYLATFFIKDI
jgi:hypothetical protein